MRNETHYRRIAGDIPVGAGKAISASLIGSQAASATNRNTIVKREKRNILALNAPSLATQTFTLHLRHPAIPYLASLKAHAVSIYRASG